MPFRPPPLATDRPASIRIRSRSGASAGINISTSGVTPRPTGDDATVALDARYNVIANVLEHNTHGNGMDAALNDVALREECLNW